MKFLSKFIFILLVFIANSTLCSDLSTASGILQSITSAHNGAFGMDNLITKPLPREMNKQGNEPVKQWNKVVDAAVEYIKLNTSKLPDYADRLSVLNKISAINQRMITTIDAAHAAYVDKKSESQIKKIISPLADDQKWLKSLQDDIKSDVDAANPVLARLKKDLKAKTTQLINARADLAKARKSLTTSKTIGDKLEVNIDWLSNQINTLNKSIDTTSLPVLLERLAIFLEQTINAVFASLERAFAGKTGRISGQELQAEITAAKAKLKPIQP